MKSPLLLIVEDVAEIRALLAARACDAFGVSECGEAGSLTQARQWLAQHHRFGVPLVALIDLDLPDGRGEELIAELGSDPAVTAIVTTVFEDEECILRALGLGARGYLLKSEPLDVIEARLRAIDQGEVPVSPQIARQLMSRLRVASSDDQPVRRELLTHREVEVLRAVGRGLTAAEAAHALGITRHTVSAHVKAIYRKLNIASRAEAALEASRRGLA